MLKHCAGALAALIGYTACDANAAEAFPRWYIGLTGKVVHQNSSDWGANNSVDYDTGHGFSGALGYRPFSLPNARFELEGTYSRNDVSTIGAVPRSGSVDMGAAMFNAFYDFISPGSRWKPYIGVGAGYARVSFEDPTDTNGKYVPAYQAKIGLAYSPEIFYDVVDLTFGYRLFGTGDAEIRGNDLSVLNHAAEIGARFNF